VQSLTRNRPTDKVANPTVNLMPWVQPMFK